jgi:hypothetical protein
LGEEEAVENKNNMTIFGVGERKGGGKKQKYSVIFLPNIHQLIKFLIKACHTHSNMPQKNVKEFDNNATKQNIR